MTDDSIIKAIKSSGGWCQLHISEKTPFGDMLGGRLVFYSGELSYIQKFNLGLDIFDGYVIILNKTQHRLKKAQWIKKILTIGGKTIDEIALPMSILAETVQELILKLQISKEFTRIRIPGKIVQGRICQASDTNISVEPDKSQLNKEGVIIQLEDILCIEVRTKELLRLRPAKSGG